MAMHSTRQRIGAFCMAKMEKGSAMIQKTDDMVGVSAAARQLGCSVTWVRLLGERGELEVFNTALGRLIPRSSIEAYQRRRAAKREKVPA